MTYIKGELDFLNFNEVHTAYEDKEHRNVCGGCGSNYVVTYSALEEAQEITFEMYEALKAIQFFSSKGWLELSLDVTTAVNNALAKAEC